jgi:hypothetical protein
MALTWNLEGIADYKATCWIGDGDDVRMNPVTETLIFGTMSVDLGSITRENVTEFAARFRVIERVHGAMLRNADGTDRYVTDDEFIAHIGLVANVSNKTRAQWARRLFIDKQSVTDDYARAMRYALAAD